MRKSTEAEILERKREILEAALHCFLNFGYSKTSMDDIAKKARISRPLIYLNFKNKEDLLIALFGYLMDGRLEEAERIAQGQLPKKEKLLQIMDIIILQPWSKIYGHPMSSEFFNFCSELDDKSFEKFEKQKHKILIDIFGDKTEAEVFNLATDGLIEDLPSSNLLKKRLEVLVEKFSK